MLPRSVTRGIRSSADYFLLTTDALRGNAVPMTPSEKTLANRSLVLILAFWGLAVIVPDFVRVFKDYGTLGFEADNNGVVTAVDGNPAMDADIRKNDCIDLKRTKLSDLLAVFGGMGGMTYVRPNLDVTLYVQPAPCTQSSSSSTPHILKSRLKRITPANRLMLGIVGVLGVFFIGIGAVLVWQKPSLMTWGFFLYGLWFNPGQYFVFYAELQRYPYLLLSQEALQAAAQAVGYAGFITFALRFPHNVVDSRWRYVERSLPALIVVLFVLQLASFGTALGFRTENIGRWSYAAGYAVDIAVLLILRARRKTQPPEDQQRTLWVHWGCRVGLLAFIFADSNMSTSFWNPVWEPFCASESILAAWTCADGGLSETVLLVFFALNATVALAVFHAVRRYRVINIRFALSRGATLLLTSLIMAGALAAISIRMEEYLHESLASKVMVYILLVFALKLVFDWLHHQFNEACDRWFFRRLHLAEERLRSAADKLFGAESLEAIDRQLIAEPVAGLDLASAAVFRRGPAGVFRQYADPIGWSGGRDAAMPLGEASVTELAQQREAIRLPEPRGSDGPKTYAPVLAMPVVAAGGLAAIVLYGGHNTGDDVTGEEHVVLRELVATAGNAYDRVGAMLLNRQVEQLSKKLEALPYDIGAIVDD